MCLIKIINRPLRLGTLLIKRMASTDIHEKAKFGFVDGSKYEQGRPSYTEEVVNCIARLVMESDVKCFPQVKGAQSFDVLELGAGTGKFTKKIIPQLKKEISYMATEPMDGFLGSLKELCPSVTTQIAKADCIPLPDSSVKNVIAAQCFHWFATEDSLKEIHRVLVPGGNFICVWNNKDWGVPWVHEIENILTGYYGDTPRAVNRTWKTVVEKFTGFQNKTHRFLEGIKFEGDREFIVDHFCTISVIAGLHDDEKESVRKRMLAVLDNHNKGKDVITLPFQTELYHSVKSS